MSFILNTAKGYSPSIKTFPISLLFFVIISSLLILIPSNFIGKSFFDSLFFNFILAVFS